MVLEFSQKYHLVVRIAFLAVLVGTLSLGRAFSVCKLFEAFGLPFYITDVFILFSFPLALQGMSALKETPALFHRPFWIFSLLGCFYMAWGFFIDQSGFALRGVVLSSYLLFVPLVWVLFKQQIKIDLFLIMLILLNVFTAMFEAGLGCEVWRANMRGFNAMLSYGILVAFLIPYGLECLKGKTRWLVWALTGINLYMIVNEGVRSAWVAIICLMVFYMIILRSRWRDLIVGYGVVCVCFMVLTVTQDFKVSSGEAPRYVARMEGTISFVDNFLSIKEKESEILSSDQAIAYSNISWRLKVWQETFHAGMVRPFFGHGFSDVLVYDGVISKSRPVGFSENSGVIPPHNEFLTVFYKMGLTGLILFIWVNGFVFMQGLKKIKTELIPIHRALLMGALGSFVVWHVMAQFFDMIDSPPTNIVLWMLLGFLLILVYRSEPNEGKQV